jgi:hypothetical protein
MAQDNTIFCASGYNDNGFDAATFDSARVWRCYLLCSYRNLLCSYHYMECSRYTIKHNT